LCYHSPPPQILIYAVKYVGLFIITSCGSKRWCMLSMLSCLSSFMLVFLLFLIWRLWYMWTWRSGSVI
jgi:hypothetical protein